jgi:TolB-like protein/Flp pilus assembly protein TadD
MTGLYIVGAWAVIQVAEVSFEAWGVPDSALRFLFIAAIACFPVALVFSWFYDITTKGIARTEKAGAGEAVDLSLKFKDYLLLAALLSVGGMILFDSISRVQNEVGSRPPTSHQGIVLENSMAVLPFTNLDMNVETGYFSDGITEEILNQLSGLKTLHVMASNSSFAFRDSQESPGEILQKLGVRFLLQGSIRREQDHVRITARLIDERGFQVWSEQFDRQLEGIFAIQTEIANTVAGKIINEIVPLSQLPEGRTTENMEAYDQYLIGRSFLDKRPPGWREQAEQAFRDAIAHDPEFSPPYAALAKAITVSTNPGPHWNEARSLAEMSLELDDALSEGHAALALVLMAEGNLDSATISARKAIDLNPSLGFAYNILAFALERMGREQEGHEARLKGLTVDPLNPPLVANVAETEMASGNYERAEQLLKRLLYLPEPPQLVYGSLITLYDSLGRFEDALDMAKQTKRVFAARGEHCCIDLIAWTYGHLGMTEAADYWMNQALEDGQLSMSTMDLTYNLLTTRDPNSELGRKMLEFVSQPGIEEGLAGWPIAQLGLANIFTGNHETGARQLEYGIRLYQSQVTGNELREGIDVADISGSEADVVMVMQTLAYSYRQLGRLEEADAILKALSAAFDLRANPLHHALSGDPDTALETMRTMQEKGSAEYFGPGKYYEIIHSPMWAETIGHPGFPELLEEIKTDVDRQRARVEAIETEHDFRAEIEGLSRK